MGLSKVSTVGVRHSSLARKTLISSAIECCEVGKHNRCGRFGDWFQFFGVKEKTEDDSAGGMEKGKTTFTSTTYVLYSPWAFQVPLHSVNEAILSTYPATSLMNVRSFLRADILSRQVLSIPVVDMRFFLFFFLLLPLFLCPPPSPTRLLL